MIRAWRAVPCPSHLAGTPVPCLETVGGTGGDTHPLDALAVRPGNQERRRARPPSTCQTLSLSDASARRPGPGGTPPLAVNWGAPRLAGSAVRNRDDLGPFPRGTFGGRRF